MGNFVSTITSKWQITLPEEVRKVMPLKIGERIVWEVKDDKLVGTRVRSISELAGSLKSGNPVAGEKGSRNALAAAAIARHQRLSNPKK